MDFKAPWELWNTLSKTIPGKFHGSGRHSKCNCLQDWADFHRSHAWQIVLIFSTALMLYCIVQKLIWYPTVQISPSCICRKYHFAGTFIMSFLSSTLLYASNVERVPIRNYQYFNAYIYIYIHIYIWGLQLMSYIHCRKWSLLVKTVSISNEYHDYKAWYDLITETCALIILLEL